MSQQFIIKLNEQGPQGAQGERGETGATGNGINYIDKTSTSGIVDTYTIYYTNGNTSTFEVTNGNSIDTIEKTSTVGIVDTYTITMVDGSTHTFTVTNGTSISSIEKTNTVGLTDTYTITLTNGDTSTFTVTNGNGIASINKTATSGLTDTYTITFTNGSTMDFNIKNGKSIVSVTGPTTLGLVDTYTINFNDNTSTTFNVTNGNGITNIEKTGSTGLLDTYTISMSNGSYETFTVTNGEKGDKGDIGIGVVGITKTSTSGLEDTYTMTYTDGHSSTFVVTNGNGIEDIELLSTEGLTNNYRINFDNGTYFDYSLDNAKSIVAISKIMTSGLIDTYRITFNDGSNFQFPITNGNGVSGITLLSWEGLDKTYRMTFTNGTYFDYIVSNGAEGQAEWGGISGILSNQHDLQDALDLKADVSQTHALKAYLDKGELLTETEGLADVTNYAHSTFDLSKFTVVGSPTITNDGIASGFSASDYIYKDINETYDIVNNTYDFSAKYIYATGGQDCIVKFGRFWIVFDNSNHIVRLQGQDSNNASKNFTNVTIPTPQNGDEYYIRGSFGDSGNIRNLTVSVNGGTPITGTDTANTPNLNTVSEIHINIGINNTSIPLTAGAVDLKYLSFAVNGVQKLSGNVTGIDVIKDVDYTITGSPKITDDGIASGFTTSDYISKDINETYDITSHTYSFKCKYTYKTGDDGVLFRIGRFWAIFDIAHNTIRLQGQDSSNNPKNFTNATISAPQDGDEYFIAGKFGNSGNIRSLSVSVNGDTPINGIDTANAPNLNTVSAIHIYIGLNVDTLPITAGLIDLNAFEFYIDGNLVYQPCLKIPYTQSKTGSKVVNSVYRDRVNDMAEQFGSAPYYTLSDTDFTLPQVELYGLIGDKTLRDSYYNGVIYWELFSNRRLEQGGSCESGVEYTLPKPFADANYVLTIPYSSKTATSFIPSATGDFIAKGIGLL